MIPLLLEHDRERMAKSGSLWGGDLMVSQEPARSRVNEAIDRLSEEFRGVFSSETIRDLVAASFESYRGSRITDFVPLLVYRSARDHLGALAQSGSTPQPLDQQSR